MPLGRFTFSMRCRMMNTLLHTIASVMATCSTISSRPVLLRISALSTGRNSMTGLPLLRLELRGGLHLAGAPGRIQTRDQAGGERDQQRQADHGPVELCQLLDRRAGVELAQRQQADAGEGQADDAAGQTDQT